MARGEWLAVFVLLSISHLQRVAAVAVRPQAAIAECSASLADITWTESISPSYCSTTQNPGIVAEFNVFTAFGSGLIPPVGTTLQLTNTVVTITLSDGRSVTIDPTLEFTSGGLDAVVTERDQTVGPIAANNMVTWSLLGLSEPAEWPADAQWPPTTPVTMTFQPLNNICANPTPVVYSFTPTPVLPTDTPTLTVSGGPAVAYCPDSKEVWAIFSYTSKHVSDVFDAVTAKAFSGATVDTLMSDVDCNEYHQDVVAKTIRIVCRPAAPATTFAGLADDMTRIQMVVQGRTLGICERVATLGAGPASVTVTKLTPSPFGSPISLNKGTGFDTSSVQCSTDALGQVNAVFSVANPNQPGLALTAVTEDGISCKVNGADSLAMSPLPFSQQVTASCTGTIQQKITSGVHAVTLQTRYFEGGASCIIGDSFGLMVTLQPRARLLLVPAGPTAVFNSKSVTQLTAKFRLTTFQAVGSVGLTASSTATGVQTCTASPSTITILQVSEAVITVTCTFLLNLVDGPYPITLAASTQDNCAGSGPVTASATVTQTLTSTNTTVAVTAQSNAAICPGAASLTFRFRYNGNNALNSPVQLRALLPGATCTVSPAAPLTGAATNILITARCTLNSGDAFAAGNYNATLAASLTGLALSDTEIGTIAVNCGASGCSALQVCGSTGPPNVAFALQCPRLPAQVALGDSLVFVFPVAATGNVAATSLTITDTLGAGLEFVNALVDYDASACSYTAANKQISCNLGLVAPGASAKVVWIAANVVASPASHTYALSGTTASNGPVTQASRSCSVPVLTPDITVVQSVDPATALLAPGNQPVFTFTSIVSAAAGSGRVNNAQLRIDLSAGLARTGDIMAQPDGTCTAGSTSFTCNWGQVAAGSPKTVVYNAFAFLIGNQSAAALVSATGGTQTTGNNAQTTSVAVQAPTSPGLFTSISAPSPIRTNADFTFTMTAGVATGSSTAKLLRLSINVSAITLTIKSVAAPNTAACVINGFLIECTWPDVAPSNSKVVQVLASVGTESRLTLTSSVSTDKPGDGGASQFVVVTATSAATQPSTIFADITSPSTRVPINQPFTLRLRGGLTAAGSLGLRLVGSVSGACSLQMQSVDPAASICSILPSLDDVSCAWGDTSGTNALREAQVTVLPTKPGTCTLSLLALAAGKSGAKSSSITVYRPTCDSFLPDGTTWVRAPGNACPAGTTPITDKGVIDPGPTTCCAGSQGTGNLQVSVTLPPPGDRLEFRQFQFIYNVSYPVGSGPASAKQVQLENTLPAILTPVSTIIVGGATCSIIGQQLTCRLGDMAQGSSVTIILRVLSKGLPTGANSANAVNKVTASCGSPASCSGEGSAAVQIRRAPRDMQLRITAKSSTKVGERFNVMFMMYPIAQRTVVNATFTGVIPPTLRTISLSQSISAAAGTCKLQAAASPAAGGTVTCNVKLLFQQEMVRIRVAAAKAGRELVTATGAWTSTTNGEARSRTVSSEVVTSSTRRQARGSDGALLLGSCCTATACDDGVPQDACTGTWTSNPNMKCGSSFCTGACCSFKGSSNAMCRRTYKWDCLPAGSAWDAKASCFAEGVCPGPEPLDSVSTQAASSCAHKSFPCRPGSSSSCCPGLACQPAGKDWTGAAPSFACQPANDCRAVGEACGPFPGAAQCCKGLDATCVVSSKSGVGYCRSRSSCKSSGAACGKDDDCCGGLACGAGKCEVARCDLAKACGDADCVARRDQLCAIYYAAAASSPAAGK